jgi:hypothetical protein
MEDDTLTLKGLEANVIPFDEKERNERRVFITKVTQEAFDKAISLTILDEPWRE